MIENQLIANKANVAQRLRAFLKVPTSRRRVTPTRPRLLHVEAMEPRFLLSGEGLILPPPPPPEEAPLAAPIQVPEAQLASQMLPVLNLGATGAQTPATSVNEVIFVDPQVKDYSALVAAALQARQGQAAPARVEVVVLDANKDGVDQITAWLKGHQDLQAVHVLSHGDEAALRLGVTTLNQANLDDYREQLAAWGAALAPGADLLLYGCDVAAGKDGAAFVDRLAQLTGADVAASTDATGAASLGGNWTLEVQTGSIGAPDLFAVTPDYSHLLATETPITSGGSIDITSSVSAKAAFQAAGNLGAQLDANSELGYTMPLVDLSFTGLIRTNDGRTLGDVLAFKTLHNTTVLDDYLAIAAASAVTPTMGGLMAQMGDYLNGIGAYSNLESVVDNTAVSAIDFSASGQVLTTTLTLSREFVQRLGFGEQLKALGLDFLGGQGIPLLADVHYTGSYDFTNGTIAVSTLDAQVKVKNPTFSAGMALGVIDATAGGTLNFDTGKVEFDFNAVNAGSAKTAANIKLPTAAGYTSANNLFTVKSTSAHALRTDASFNVAGSIGGTTLATIAGGTPHIDVSFGGLSITSLVTNAAEPTISGTATLLTGQTLEVTVAGATYAVTPVGNNWSLNLGTATPDTGTLALGSGVITDVVAKVVKTSGGATVSSVTGTIEVNPTVDAVLAHTVTPILSGVARLAAGQTLSVSISDSTNTNSRTYSYTPSTPNGTWTFDSTNGAWTLDLTTPGIPTQTTGTLTLATGTLYTVTASVSGIPAVTGQLTIQDTTGALRSVTAASTTSTPGATITGSVAWNALQPAPFTLTSSNFSNLQAFSSLTSTQLVKMLQDLGTYLGLLRDSGSFDALLPFTDLKLGQALDFGAAISDVINNQLATTLRSGITASKAVSPVLGSNVVFDLQLQRPGDERVTTIAIAVLASETTGFTHVNQLAQLIGQKIDAAVNGWLAWTGPKIEVTETLTGGPAVSGLPATNAQQTVAIHASSGTYQLKVGAGGTATGNISVLATPIEVQNALEAVVGLGNVVVTGRPDHYLIDFVGSLAGTNVATLQVAASTLTGGSLIDVTAGEFARGPDGKTWGKISLLQANPGDFSVFRVAPSSGMSVQQIAGGSDTEEAVQRLFVIHGGNGSFILKGASDAFTTAPISIDGLGASAAQTAIVNALSAAITGSTGMWVSEVSADYAADNGTRVFDIGFGQVPVTPATNPATTKYVAYGAMTADLSTASVSIVQTAAGDASTNAVQTLTINKTRAGSYVLKGTTASGLAFATAPLAYAATAADIQASLRSAVGLSGLTVSEAGTTGVFTVTFEKKTYAKMTAANVWTSQVPAQAVVSTQQVAADAVGSTAARNEIQRLSIANASSGTFVLGTTLNSLLFETGNIAYGASNTDVQSALVAMLQKSTPAAVSASDVGVTKTGNVYDIEFRGRWAAQDVPQLRINSQKLVSPASANYAPLEYLGFLPAGQDGQVNNVTTFVTLNEMVGFFQQAVNANLNGAAAFSVNPRFDAATKSFLFDVRLTPVKTRAVNLSVSSSVGELSSLSADTTLDLDTQTLFQGTIGFDFSSLNTFALRAAGAYSGTITAAAGNKTLVTWANSGTYGDAPFNISFNGESYDLTLLQSAVAGNTTRDNLVTDLQDVFNAQTVTPGGVLARRGFANLGQVVTVGKKADGQLTLTVNAPVDQVQLTISAPPSGKTNNPLDDLLGFKTMPTYPAPKTVTLPTDGILSAAAHFSLKVDQSNAIAVTVARDAANTTTADLIADINTALNNLSVSGHAYLGTGAGGKGFSNLGQVIQASLRNGQIELVTQSAKIASLQIQVDGADPATRELGFTPGQFATTTGAYVFLQDVTLGGNYSAVIHGQVGSVAATLATPGQATLGMLDLTFGKLATDYQGSMSFNLRNGLAGAAHDRISLNDLFDSASAQGGLLGLGSTLATSGTISSPNAPYQSNGQLLRDVGLTVTVGSTVLDVVVKKSATDGTASSTTPNTSIADLAADVNAAIHAALVAKFTTDPYSTHTFVTADSVSVAGKTVLKFTAPTTTLTLASTPSQIYDATAGVLLVDLPLTVTVLGNTTNGTAAKAGYWTMAGALPASLDITPGTNDGLSWTLDGATAQSITLTAGHYASAGALLTEIQTRLAAKYGVAVRPLAGLTPGNALTLTSPNSGATSGVGGVTGLGGLAANGTVTAGAAPAAGYWTSVIALPASMDVVAGVNDSVSWKLDGTTAQSIILTAGHYASESAVLTEIQARLAAKFGAGVRPIASLTSGNELTLTSPNTGTASSISDVVGLPGATVDVLVRASSAASNTTLAELVTGVGNTIKLALSSAKNNTTDAAIKSAIDALIASTDLVGQSGGALTFKSGVVAVKTITLHNFAVDGRLLNGDFSTALDFLGTAAAGTTTAAGYWTAAYALPSSLVVVAGENDSLSWALNGTTAQSITLTPGNYASASTLLTEIQARLAAKYGAGVRPIASLTSGNELTLTSPNTGIASSITGVGGTFPTSPKAALTFSAIGVTTPAGITAVGLNGATTITVAVSNMADALAGTAVQANAVVVPPDGLGSLTPFKDIRWADLRTDLGQLGSLFGDLGADGAFGELGRALPILGTSVSDLFDFSTRFGAIDAALGQPSGIGLNGLKAALATAFGISVSDVALSYGAGNLALNIDIPYRVVLDQTRQIELILNDTALLDLLSPADKTQLGNLLGAITRMKDADSSALLNLHADMTFHLAFGIDLSGGPNQGKLFLYDHVAAGVSGFAEDTGTFVRLDALSASASGMAFSSTQGIYNLGVSGGSASLAIVGSSGLQFPGTATAGTSTVAGYWTGTNDLPSSWKAVAGVNDTLSWALDGVKAQSITLTAGTYANPAAILAEVQAQLAAKYAANVRPTASLSGNALRLTSPNVGTASGIAGVASGMTVGYGSGLMLHSDAKDGAADGRLYLRPYAALSSVDASALKQSNFEVIFDGSADVALPMTLSVSDNLGQLAMTQIDGFLNPLPLGTMEINFANLGDTFARMGGKGGFTLGSSAESSHTVISSQVEQAALPARPSTGNGSAAATPEGVPIDSTDESGLVNVNPNPYFSSTEGDGASTAQSGLTVSATQLFGAGDANANSEGFDVSLIIPDFAYWQTQLTHVLNAAVGESCDPEKILNAPLIFLLRDPSIIVNTVDKVLGGLQQGLDAFSSVLNLPIIGDQLKEATQFVAGLRTNVVGAIKQALDSAVDTYGGLDNALRMFLFNMLTTDTNNDYIIQQSEINSNIFLNFLRDYNGDGLITPDDIVVEYVAGTGQPELDSRLADYLGVTQTSGPIPTVLPGQRTAWVTSGINVPKLDTEGNQLYHDDGTPCYVGEAGNVVLDSSLQKIVDDVAGAIDSVSQTALDALVATLNAASAADGDSSVFMASARAFAQFVIQKAAAGYHYADLLKDVFGAGVIAASLSDVFDTFEPSSEAVAADAATLKYNLDHGLTGTTGPNAAKIPKAVLGEFKKAVQAQAEEIATELALGSSTAVQFRMNLGQTYTPSLDLSFDIGVPGLSLALDGGIGLILSWDLYLGFGVDVNDGFYLVTNMPGTAGIGEITTYGSGGVATGTEVNSSDAHIDNLWMVGKPTFTPAVTELQAQIDVYLKPGSGGGPASLNAQLFVVNGTLTDNWDGWIKDNDTGIWGSGTDTLGRLSGTLNPTYGRTTELFDGDTGAWGSRTRLQLNFGVDLKDVGLFGISQLADFTNGRLTYSDLRNADLADLYEVEWSAKAQINLHMGLGISAGGDGYLPKIVGDFHLTWQDSNENEYVKQIKQYFTSGYDSLFHAGEPNIWMTDVYIDVGTFFTKFLNPIVSVIQDVTDPIMPVIDALTTPIPGLSDLMGRDYSVVDLASDMSALFGGISKLDFIIAMVNLLDTIDHLPTNTNGMLLPVTQAFIVSGSRDRQLNLSALPSIVPDVTIDLPYAQLADVNVSKDGFEFGLEVGVGWKDDPATSGTNEGQTTLLKVFQGQTPDLSFDFNLTADAKIPAPYVEATPFDFTIAGIYNRDGVTLAHFKLHIKAGWPDLRLSDILNGNMAPKFDLSLELPDIDFTPNLLPVLKFVMPKLVATVNGTSHTLLGGGTLTVDWPNWAQGFVNSADVRTFTGPTADINLGTMPDFLLPLPYVDLTPIDISANLGFASGSVFLNVKAGWKDLWLSDFLSGNMAPSFDATLSYSGTASLPVVEVRLPQMTWTMGAKTWTWAAGGTQTIDWPSALSGLVNTGTTVTIDLRAASFNVDLGTIHGFLPTITVEWPDVHWVGLGKEFNWQQTDTTDLGWSGIISDTGILSALIDPAKQITIKLPDVWLPSVNLLDLLPNIDWNFSLPGLPSLPNIDISLPSIDVPGQQTVGPQDALNDFQSRLKKPGSAWAFPIIDDPIGSVIGLLMGEPVDLMTFTPPNLEVSVGFRVSYPVYPPLNVGLGGEIKLSAALTLGFDTYGITKFVNTHNLTDIFDGFYVSDNIVNGVDQPEVTLNAKLYAFAELNAFIVRGGVEGGIKLLGTLDIYDEDLDNKYRASELIAAVSEDPLDVVSMHLSGSAYISAYVDLFGFIDWFRVWEWTFVDVTLFTWDHDPAAKKPVLGSMDGTTLTLHMGSTIGSIDGQDAVTKGAADRLRRSTDDGNESYTLTGSNGTVDISALLTNGNTYTKTFAGVTKVKAFAGAGNDTIDASGLDRPVLFIAGGGTDLLKGGSAADVLVGSDTGTATLWGGGGDDLLIARGGTTHMFGGTDVSGSGNDTYRFLVGWGVADIIDGSGTNILDFRPQISAVTFDDSVGEAFQGSNLVTWTKSSDKIDLVKGGSGSDVLDFSGDAANLLVTVTGTNAGWVKGSGSGMTQTSFSGTTAAAMTTAGDNAGFGFKFEGFENAIGGQGSDVFRIRDGASLTGSIQGNPSSGNEIANARNTIDFSEYTTGVTVNEESTSAFGTANATNIIIRGFHNIFGGSGGDSLSGDGRNNLIVGNNGTDVLEGKAGHDLLVADTFRTYENLITGETRPLDADLTPVTDYVSLQKAGAGAGFGSGIGTDASRNWIWKGQTLENLALATAGSQTLKGGSGNDVIMGSKGGDIINIGGSGEGNDTIIADLGKLEIDFNYRSALSATSFGGSVGGGDTIYLGSGNNLVIAGNGNDTIYGADVAGSFNIILADNGTVQFKTTEVTIASGIKLTFASANGLSHLLDYVDAPVNENSGSAGNDTVSLSSGSGIVLGGGGNDVIFFSAATSTGANVRFIAGDHARVNTDARGGVTEFYTLDTLSTSGGNDVILIGSDADLAARHLGSNFILGGMGDDTIVVSGAIDSAGTITRGLARSEDVILGDNGKITRTASVAAATNIPNRMLKVESTQTANDKGGADKIIAANGGKVIIGGVGADTITAKDGDNLVIGDNGQIDFDTSGSGILRKMQSIATDQGGADTITLNNGFKMVIAGFGKDIVDILASNLGDAIGPFTVTGIVAATGTTEQKRGRSGRYVSGDNAVIDFDSTGGLTDLVTDDPDGSTGDADTITIGLATPVNNTVDIGINIIAGGMGADTITVLGVGATGTSFDTILGDNGEVHRNNYSVTGTEYALRDVHSTYTGFGGGDTISTANGDKVILGGYGGDTITVATVSTSKRFISGDNATLTFDTTGGMTDLVTMDTASSTGDADTITVGLATPANNTFDIGTNVIAGGMGADTITVLGVGSTGTSFDTILGDNGEVHRNNSTKSTPYALRDVHSIQTDKGGNDTILTGIGDKVILGGYGADTITVSLAQANVNAGAVSSNMRFVSGDNASMTFDVTGGMTDLVTLDTQAVTGGGDTIKIGTTLTAGQFGTNMVVAGMGNDTVLVGGASYDAVLQKLTAGAALSEDILIGDNGEIHRTAATSAATLMINRNLMLQAKTKLGDQGGNDIIGSGSGGKVILGGFGSDLIAARDGDHIVAGDNAQVNYDVNAGNGVLREVKAVELTLGGSDTITLNEGYKVVMGGIGGDASSFDTIDIAAVGVSGDAVAHAVGSSISGQTLGLTGIASVAGKDAAETKGRTGRFVVGDNATISFDAAGGLTDIVTTDAITATGGRDAITLGAQSIATETDLGYQVVIGGMAADTINIRSLSRSEDYILGDSGEFHRTASGYGVTAITSTATGQGASDTITSGRGVKVVIGGDGADVINLATVYVAGKTDRALVLGDSGDIRFDASGAELLESVSSFLGAPGDMDSLTVGDGDLAFVGGQGADSLTVNSILSYFRTAVGDNATLQFATANSWEGSGRPLADLSYLQTTDTSATSGGADGFQVGYVGDSSHSMGQAILVGGVGGDSLKVAGKDATTILAGDNVEIRRSPGVAGQPYAVTSLSLDQGGGDTLEAPNGWHVLVGGMAGDTIRSGKGEGVVLGDSGTILYSSDNTGAASGKLSAVISSGLSQGGGDSISLGAGSATVDGNQVVIGGYGADTISMVALAGYERMISGDAVDVRFDTAGRMVSFTTSDVTEATGGNDQITLGVGLAAGTTIWPVAGTDVNVVAGGVGDDRIAINAGGFTTDVVSGDNLDYRRGLASGAYQHRFADVLTPLLGGNDTIVVGGGDKLIFGGAGNDTLESRTGNDTGERTIMFGDAGTVTFAATLTGALVRAFTTAEGNGGNDELNVASGPAYLFGGKGNDSFKATGFASERVAFGDNGQVDWNTDGTLYRLQTTGSDALDPNLTADSFDLPLGLSTNEPGYAPATRSKNYIFGGPGVDLLVPVLDVVNGDDVAIPGTGAVTNPGQTGQVISVVMLGEFREFSIVPEDYSPVRVKPDPNAPPPAGGGSVVAAVSGTGAVTEDGVTTANGQLAYPSINGGNASFVGQPATAGAYGNFVLDSGGNWTYTLANSSAAVQALAGGQQQTETFVAHTTEGSTTTVTITITGTDDAPVLGGVVIGTVAEDGTATASGTLTISDADTLDNPVSFPDVASTAGGNGYGSFVLAGSTWTYTLDNASVQFLDAGQSVSDNYIFTATDGSTSTVTVTINGAEDVPVLGGVVIGTVAEDGTATATGTLTISDVDTLDNPVSFPSVGTTAGSNGYGSFVLAGSNWTYTLDNSAVQFLGAGQSATDSHIFTATDGSTRTVTITINGSNDAATVSSATVALAETDAALTSSGTLTSADVDNAADTFTASSTTGTIGDFSIDVGGAWTFTANSAFDSLNVGDSVSETYNVSSVDGTTSTVTITINGAANAPVLGGVVVSTGTPEAAQAAALGTSSTQGSLTGSDGTADGNAGNGNAPISSLSGGVGGGSDGGSTGSGGWGSDTSSGSGSGSSVLSDFMSSDSGGTLTGTPSSTTLLQPPAPVVLTRGNLMFFRSPTVLPPNSGAWSNPAFTLNETPLVQYGLLRQFVRDTLPTVLPLGTAENQAPTPTEPTTGGLTGTPSGEQAPDNQNAPSGQQAPTIDLAPAGSQPAAPESSGQPPADPGTTIEETNPALPPGPGAFDPAVGSVAIAAVMAGQRPRIVWDAPEKVAAVKARRAIAVGPRHSRAA